jgi:hypothetical protein
MQIGISLFISMTVLIAPTFFNCCSACQFIYKNAPYRDPRGNDKKVAEATQRLYVCVHSVFAARSFLRSGAGQPPNFHF